MEQEAVGGNVFEVHQQADLTPSVFSDRFPIMETFKLNEKYGLYFNYNFL
jgi:hypothetical protein